MPSYFVAATPGALGRAVDLGRKPVGTGWRGWLPAICLAFLPACGITAAPVVRVADGVEVEGRAVSPQAYEHYARGLWREAARDDAGALVEYQHALAEDPNAAELLARVGAVQCRAAKSARDRSAKAGQLQLQRALRSDPRHAGAWVAQARCLAHLRQPEPALSAILRAAQLDSNSESINALVVEFAQTAGDVALLRRWLDAWVVRRPAQRSAWEKLQQFAERSGDLGRERLALAALAELGRAPSSMAQLERALSRDDPTAAGSAANALRLRAGELAARAMRAGASSVARQHAERVHAADPDDEDAWVTLLTLADHAQDSALLDQLLRHPASDAATLSSAGGELWSELLERRVGAEARRAWEAAHATPRPASNRRE